MDVRVRPQYADDDTTAELEVFVQLSEHNLRDLMAQYEDDRMVLRQPYADLHRRCDNVLLHVEVIPDDMHYGDRTPGIGSGLV